MSGIFSGSMKIKDHPYWIPYASVKSERLSQDRLLQIRKLKQENPDANHKWLATMAFDTTYAVKKALKDYHPEEMLNST